MADPLPVISTENEGRPVPYGTIYAHHLQNIRFVHPRMPPEEAVTRLLLAPSGEEEGAPHEKEKKKKKKKRVRCRK